MSTTSYSSLLTFIVLFLCTSIGKATNNTSIFLHKTTEQHSTIGKTEQDTLQKKKTLITPLEKGTAVEKDTISLLQENKTPLKMTKKKWLPNSGKAAWLAAVFPGGGQIYNRKYWKLPIVYGGLMGCAYALSWNNKMYTDYSRAYLDIMDDNSSTNSYLNYLPDNFDITGKEDQYQTIFKKRKDFYRRNRDLSIFAFIGVYVLSIVDAYVDAELSNFDITKDLGVKIEPAIITNQQTNKTFGMQCSITF
ncbi:MAG: DUF5683 domain-containing protein [Bacteroidaceae bacterium]|nr:DUF5683 domain-containing protein [Bacteroidaceae bacterium]